MPKENDEFESGEERELDRMDIATQVPITKEITLDELAKILDTTVKHDRENKLITFLVMLGTYTDEEQTNIMYMAESSTGKSYIPLQIVEYFPGEDVEKVSYASPTSFYHSFGKPVYEEIDPMTVEEEDGKKKKKKRRIKNWEIDMSRKIYIFKDMPSTKLIDNHKDLLSHDERTQKIQITEKTYKYGYRARKAIIHGYPTWIFCTASKRLLNPQIKNRFFILSPWTDPKKIEEAIRLLSLRKGNRRAYEQYLQGFVGRQWLQNRIREIKTANVYDVIIENHEEVAEKFLREHPNLAPRGTRDFGRLLSLIKYWALFNFWNRKQINHQDGLIVYADKNDVKVGFELYTNICRSNELGITPELLEIYERIFVEFDGGDGLTREEISTSYRKVFNRPLSQRRLEKEILPNLLAAGLVIKDETTGKGRVPQKFKLVDSLDVKEDGVEIQTTLGKKPPTNNDDKLKILLDVLTVPIKREDIHKHTNGQISRDEIPKLLQILNNSGKIFQPSDGVYQRTF